VQNFRWVGLHLATTLKCLENSFQHFWQLKMKKCSSLYVYKNKWELYKNLNFLVEVALSGMKTVGDLGNPNKHEFFKEIRIS